jgi:transcription elongation factor/antiterminator RfaH
MSTVATITARSDAARSLVTAAVSNGTESQWYAAYTFAKHEKRVAQQLDERRIESFLPIYRAIRKWKDRKKELQLPLFPSYVFVRIDIKDRLRVQQVPGVVSFVSFGGIPVPLRSSDVETLRQGSVNPMQIAPHPYLKVGRRVRIASGPFAGTEGVLTRRRNGCRVVIAIDLLQRSVAVEADEADLQAI